MTTREERLIVQAREAFRKHVIRQRSEGRWLLQARRQDGGWDWTMAAEVISLYGGCLFVGGDIDHVVFGYCSHTSNHERKLRWMGECTDIDYYVAQKARIGMVGTECVDVFDPNEAEDTVKDWLRETRKERDDWDPESTDELIVCLEELVESMPDTEGEIWQELWRVDPDFAQDTGSLKVVSARVYYAHAALARLCQLLDQEKSP
jgi:hypothetical protein